MDLPYNELAPQRGLVDAVKGAVLALATRREVEEFPESRQAGAGIATALQGDGAVPRGQVTAGGAGAGAEGGHRHGLRVALGVTGVLHSSAGG